MNVSVSLVFSTKVTPICPGWQPLNSLLCFFLFNMATSLQCSNFYFGASVNYENPRGNLFTMVMLFANVLFLTIWVWLCYVMCLNKLLWSYKSSIQITSPQGFRVGLFYVPRKVSQLRTKNKQRSCVSLCFLSILILNILFLGLTVLRNGILK